MVEHLNRLLKGSFIYGIGSVANQFLSILLLPLFTGLLSPKDYGITATLNVFGLVLTTIFSLGTSTSTGICYFDTKNKEKRTTIIWSSFFTLLVSSIVMLMLNTSLIKQITLFLLHSSSYDYLVFLTIWSIVFYLLTNPFLYYLQFEEKSLAYIIFSFVSTLLTLTTSILLVAYFKRGVYGMVEATILGRLLAFILIIVFVSRKIRIRVDFSIIKDLIFLGLPMIPSFFALYVLQQGNIIVLQKLRTLDEVGLYSVGNSLGLGLMIVVSAFSTSWAPFFLSFSNKREIAGKLFGRISTYYIIIVGSLSLLFYIFAKPVVMILTNPAYYSSYKIIGLTATAQFFIGIFNILLPPTYYEKEVKYTTIIQVVSSLIFVIFSVFLSSMFGIMGAAISLVIGYASMALLLHLWNVHNKKYFKIEYEWIRIKKFLSVYSLFIIFALVDKRINVYIETPLMVIIFIAMMLFFYKLIDSKEKSFLKNKAVFYLSKISKK